MRTAHLLVFFLLFGALPCSAADPTAYGTVVIDSAVMDDAPNTTGAITVKGSVTANATWSPGDASVFAIKSGGGYIYSIPATSLPVFMDNQKKTFEAKINLPNGTFKVWAVAVMTKGADKQKVGSALASLTVANSTTGDNDNLLVPANYTSGYPTRTVGNGVANGDGNFKPLGDYVLQEPTDSTANNYPKWYAVPKDGGWMRETPIFITVLCWEGGSPRLQATASAGFPSGRIDTPCAGCLFRSARGFRPPPDRAVEPPTCRTCATPAPILQPASGRSLQPTSCRNRTSSPLPEATAFRRWSVHFYHTELCMARPDPSRAVVGLQCYPDRAR